MQQRQKPPFQNPRRIRHWTLYVVRLSGNHYYVGITARRDFMRRIRQHGGPAGARVNLGKQVEEIIEIQDLGLITGLQAGAIENDVTLQYRKRYGRARVRGGYEVFRRSGLVPTYTPGSWQSYALIVGSLLVACCLLLLSLAAHAG